MRPINRQDSTGVEATNGWRLKLLLYEAFKSGREQWRALPLCPCLHVLYPYPVFVFAWMRKKIQGNEIRKGEWKHQIIHVRYLSCLFEVPTAPNWEYAILPLLPLSPPLSTFPFLLNLSLALALSLSFSLSLVPHFSAYTSTEDEQGRPGRSSVGCLPLGREAWSYETCRKSIRCAGWRLSITGCGQCVRTTAV